MRSLSYRVALPRGRHLGQTPALSSVMVPSGGVRLRIWVLAARAALMVVLLGPAAALAQTLSPGPLSKAHDDLEGLSNCTKCHEVGQKLDGTLCLECHTTLKRYIERDRGMHARQKAEHGCMDCHKEHRGENAAITDWGGPRDRFNHKRTGWPLEGKHEDVK